MNKDQNFPKDAVDSFKASLAVEKPSSAFVKIEWIGLSEDEELPSENVAVITTNDRHYEIGRVKRGQHAEFKFEVRHCTMHVDSDSAYANSFEEAKTVLEQYHEQFLRDIIHFAE